MKLYVYPDGWHLTYDDGRGTNAENSSMSGTEMSDVYAKHLQQCFTNDYNEPCQLVYVDEHTNEPEQISEFAIIRS